MIGMPGIIAILAFGLFAVIPWIAGVCGLLTLYRMRTTQDAMRAALDRIEQRLPYS
jgi:hypothetical protein